MRLTLAAQSLFGGAQVGDGDVRYAERQLAAFEPFYFRYRERVKLILDKVIRALGPLEALLRESRHLRYMTWPETSALP